MKRVETRAVRAEVAARGRTLSAGGELEERIVDFSTMTIDLLAHRDSLEQLDITHVATEASGVYSKLVYNPLEDDFELLLL